MSENLPRPIRKVGIADHLWDVLDQMAREMGSEREGLVNQALFMFARLNGFLGNAAPSGPVPRSAPAAGRAAANDAAASGDRTPQPVPEAKRPTVAPGLRPPPRDLSGDPPVLVKGPRKVVDLAPPPPEFEEEDEEEPPLESMDDDPQRKAVAQRVLETAAELESMIKGKQAGEPAAHDPMGGSGAGPSLDHALYLSTDGRETERVAKDRYLIGRGKHCDLVINSGKVSREHAAIVRDGDDFFIQDLDSSNGTWFNKQRIKRRKIEDGDEYFICSDRVKLTFR